MIHNNVVPDPPESHQAKPQQEDHLRPPYVIPLYRESSHNEAGSSQKGREQLRFDPIRQEEVRAHRHHRSVLLYVHILAITLLSY